MAETYDVGDGIKLAITFQAGTPAVDTDPSTVTLLIRDPDAVVVSYTYAAAEITKDATGKYSKIIDLTKAGIWSWRWIGTGSVKASEQGQVTVRRPLPPAP